MFPKLVHIFKVRPWCPIPFDGRIIFPSMERPHFVHLFIMQVLKTHFEPSCKNRCSVSLENSKNLMPHSSQTWQSGGWGHPTPEPWFLLSSPHHCGFLSGPWRHFGLGSNTYVCGVITFPPWRGPCPTPCWNFETHLCCRKNQQSGLLKTSFQPPAPIPLYVAVVWHPERNTGIYKFLYNVGGHFCLQHLLCKPGLETKSTVTKNKSKNNCAHQVWGTHFKPSQVSIRGLLYRHRQPWYRLLCSVLFLFFQWKNSDYPL